MAVIVAVATVAVLVGVMAHEREPEYQGRKLSEWMVDLRPNGLSPDEFLKRKDQAKKAIRSMGTNAVPYFMSRIKTPDSSVRQWCSDWSDRLTWCPVKVSPADEIRGQAQYASTYLDGEAAHQIVAELITMMQKEKNEEFAAEALWGIALRQPDLVAVALREARKNPATRHRRWIEWLLEQLGSHSDKHSEVLPDIIIIEWKPLSAFDEKAATK